MDTAISIVRGTTNTFRISIKTQAKTPYELQEGEILRLGIKENYHRSKYLVKVEVGPEAIDDGDYLITLHPEDTKNLECKRYVYDVGLQSGAEYYMIIPYTGLDLIPNITSYEYEEEEDPVEPEPTPVEPEPTEPTEPTEPDDGEEHV